MTPTRRALARRALMAACAALMAAPMLAPSARADDEKLILAFIPQENLEKLIGDIEVISGWLAERLGVPVDGFVTVDHAAGCSSTR